MKIQKLTIHNIASIEDAVIDFEASPLVDSEVFLITGKTGAGKSTILDAICLALFADTPRLDGTKMEGDTKDGDNSVKIDDPRQLMRRNTGEAFVSLTFTGSNGIHYKATWSVARSYKKPSGNLRPKEWEWENLDAKKSLKKDTEIKAEIKNAIGLEFDQFCRTTVLAQGEFTRFLNSDDKEKAKILEKITGVDIYSKIGAKVYAVTVQKEGDWKTAQKLVDGSHNPSDEDLARKQNEIKGLDAQYEACKQLYDKDKAKQQWIKTDNENSKSLVLATERYGSAVTAVESEEFKTNETLVRQWNETIEARGWLAAKKAAEVDVSRQKNEFKALGREFTDVLGGFAFAEQERKDKDSERNKLPEVKPQEEALTKQQLDELRKQRDDAKEEIQNIATANLYIELYIKAKERKAQTEKMLNDTHAEIETKRKEVAKLEPLLHDAKVIMEDRKEMLDKQSDTIDKFAQTLRQKLKIGDVCPVCRQEIKSELPHEEELAQFVNGLRVAFTEAESAYTELLNKKNKLDAEIQATTKSYQTAKATFNKDNSVAETSQKVIVSCKACGFETIKRDTPQALEALKTKTEAILHECETKIKDLEKKVSNYQELIRRRQALDLQLAEMTNKCQTAKDAIEEILRLMPDWKSLSSPAVRGMPDLPKKANDARSKIFTALSKLQQAEETITLNNQQIDDFLSSHTEISMERLIALNAYTAQSISGLNASLDKVRNEVLAAKTLKEEAVRKQEEHRHAKPELNEEDTLEILDARITAHEKTLKDIAIQKGSLDQELKRAEEDQKQHAKFNADAEMKKADYQKWSRMNQYIGDATGSKFRKIAQSYILSSLIRSANSYMSTLTDRYTLYVTPGTFVISIEDAYQGFTRRAASTISGGESFLVSLSLALALSDIGQQLAVDTLFIDEGFGTLSGEPLQNAVNTLRSLHTKAGRHVGIISHVEELKERIPVQIQVNQEGNNSSSTVLIVPSAPSA